MTQPYSQTQLLEMAGRWVKADALPRRLEVITDTSDYYRVDFNDVVLLDGVPYLVRNNAKEGRFGIDEQEKYWVKRAVKLEDGAKKIIKLVFYERFTATIGKIAFECFRSPRKEARILALVKGLPNFMQGVSITDDHGNVVRILDLIQGKTLDSFIFGLPNSHEEYFAAVFPGILDHFIECVAAIRLLHDNGEKHGDIRRDHILIDSRDGRYRWIDFDFNYRHRENIYGYDLFGLGNVLAFITGKGDVLVNDVIAGAHGAPPALTTDDINIVFRNRVVNLRKIFPYIPKSLNRILMHFSETSNRFYLNTGELLEDLREARSAMATTP
jgi:hypothetical protein